MKFMANVIIGRSTAEVPASPDCNLAMVLGEALASASVVIKNVVIQELDEDFVKLMVAFEPTSGAALLYGTVGIMVVKEPNRPTNV